MEAPNNPQGPPRVGGIAHEHQGAGQEAQDGKTAGDVESLVEGLDDAAPGAALAHEPGADDGSQDGNAAEGQRVQHRRVVLEQQLAEQHGGDDRDRVGLEEIGGHARAVPDVVAHVIGDHRRVARIVFRDPGLHLAHQVGAHIGPLGEDAAPQAREDGDEGAAEAQADERLEIHGAAVRRLQEIEVVAGHAEQPQADHQDAGDGAAAEGHGQCRVQAGAGRLRGAQVGPHRHVHADVAGGAGEQRADEEAEAGAPAQAEAQDQEQHQAHERDSLVLAVQVGGGALLYGGGDFAHALAALWALQHPVRAPGAVADAEQGAE